MKAPLAEEIIAAEAHLALLRKRAEGATCAEVGHDWKMMGGVNCATAGGCGNCSVAVNECARCKDCDYGEGEEAKHQVEACRCMIEL